jgi:hypothetical protein
MWRCRRPWWLCVVTRSGRILTIGLPSSSRGIGSRGIPLFSIDPGLRCWHFLRCALRLQNILRSYDLMRVYGLSSEWLWETGGSGARRLTQAAPEAELGAVSCQMPVPRNCFTRRRLHPTRTRLCRGRRFHAPRPQAVSSITAMAQSIITKRSHWIHADGSSRRQITCCNRGQ